MRRRRRDARSWNCADDELFNTFHECLKLLREAEDEHEERDRREAEMRQLRRRLRVLEEGD